MFRKISKRIKKTIIQISESRLLVLILVFCFLYAVLINRLFGLQIVKGEYYMDNYKLQIRKERDLQGTRGSIYDRNGDLLAYNELAYSVTFEDDISGTEDRNETLNRIMGETLEKFWGSAVELTEGAELTWMRQPHYYMGLYSYTYSAGLTVATQACKRIEQEGALAVEDWKRVLSAGGTKTPLELARMAGVDISTDAPLLDTIETIGGYIDEICRLTEELA